MDIVATFPAGTGGKSVITCLQYLFDMACDTVDLLMALHLSNVSPCFVIDSQLWTRSVSRQEVVGGDQTWV